MSKVADSFTTPKGTRLTVRNLRGKEYLDVAQRLRWFVEENARYDIQTKYLVLNEDETVAETTVTILSDTDKIQRRAAAIKRETKEDFADHAEKANTSSLGRALAMLGYGTQFTADELEEGNRLADSPIEPAKKSILAAVEDDAQALAAPIANGNGARPSFKARRNVTTELPGDDV